MALPVDLGKLLGVPDLPHAGPLIAPAGTPGAVGLPLPGSRQDKSLPIGPHQAEDEVASGGYGRPYPVDRIVRALPYSGPCPISA